MKQGWEIIKLSEISENLDCKRVPITLNKRIIGNIPYYGASGIVDYISDFIFDENLLCVSEDGANLLARTYPIAFSISGKTWVNNHAHVLRFKNLTTQKFVEVYLNSICLNDYVSGMAQPKLNQAMLNKIPIPLPPLPEQHRIVSLLDEAFAAIDKAKANAEQNLKNAKELFESYLQGVFEKQGEGWEEKRFEELIKENQIGLIKSTREQGNNKPYRYLKMDSITSDNNLIHNKYVFVDATKDEIEKFKLYNGDFLFNTRNSYELVGKTCVFSPIDDEPTLFNNNIMRVVFIRGISSRFINYAFSSELVKERLQKLKSGTTSVVGIYYKGLRNLKIPVPNFVEQQTIVRQLDALRAETQKLDAIYQLKLLNLEVLKKSVLQKAFTGELLDKNLAE